MSPDRGLLGAVRTKVRGVLRRPGWLPAWVRVPQLDPVAWAVLLVAASICAQTIYIHHSNDVAAAHTAAVDAAREKDHKAAERDAKAQRICLSHTITDLTDALTARAGITGQHFTTDEGFLLDVLKVKTKAEFRTVEKAFRRALAGIYADSAKNPVPDYPTGLCSDAKAGGP